MCIRVAVRCSCDDVKAVKWGTTLEARTPSRARPIPPRPLHSLFLRPNNMLSLVLVLALACTSLSFASLLTPPVLPLIVRNPYLSTWLPHARGAPWEHWPMFWTGQEIGFSVLASIPSTSTVYPLLGRPQDSIPSNRYVQPPKTHTRIFVVPEDHFPNNGTGTMFLTLPTLASTTMLRRPT